MYEVLVRSQESCNDSIEMIDWNKNQLTFFMINKLYDYLDHKKYLKDFYEDKKKNQKGFSYQVFADNVGFKSKSYIQDVIRGKRNLSQESLFKLTQYFKLSPKQTAYFQDIVEFNQAKNSEQKQYYLQRILEVSGSSSVTKLVKDQYEFYSKWHHNTIREIVSIYDFKGNFKRLGEMLSPSISAIEAQKSIELLLKLGLIEKEGKSYHVSDEQISSGNEVASTFVSMFHQENLSLALNSVGFISNQDRDLSCLVLRLSKNRFKEIREDIREFRKKLLKKESPTKETEGIFHINFQVFPTTKAFKANK